MIICKLNIVVNDLNDVQEICNPVGSIRCVITFFRERFQVLSTPLFCEPRWTEKYIISRNFCSIVKALHGLTKAGSNVNTIKRTCTYFVQLPYLSVYCCTLFVIGCSCCKYSPRETRKSLFCRTCR